MLKVIRIRAKSANRHHQPLDILAMFCFASAQDSSFPFHQSADQELPIRVYGYHVRRECSSSEIFRHLRMRWFILFACFGPDERPQAQYLACQRNKREKRIDWIRKIKRISSNTTSSLGLEYICAISCLIKVAAYATVRRETPPRSRSFFMALCSANCTLDHAKVLLSEMNGVICLRALTSRPFSSHRSTYSTRSRSRDN